MANAPRIGQDSPSTNGALASVNIRTRKLIGTFLLLALIVVYSLIAMLFAVHFVLDLHSAIQVAYFVAAGLLWLPPAMVLVRWMQRPDG